jgi:hypothetical protein
MSYLEIVNSFKAACNSHLAINSFGEGAINQLNNIQNIKYPYCFLRPISSTGLLLNNDGYGSGRSLTLELYLLDIPKISDEDQTKLMSNCEQYVYDVLSYFNFGPETYNMVVTMTGLVPLYEAFDDRTTGWMATLEIKTPFIQDYCNFPKI